MSKGPYHIKGFDMVTEDIEVHVTMKPTTDRLNTAFRNLKTNIMNGMQPLMPIGNTGNLTRLTRAANTALLDEEYMYAAAGPEAGGVPYGRFHHRGKVMVGEKSRSPWARKHEKKEVTDQPLKWSNPNAVAYWDEAAKKRHLKAWIALVQEDMEGK